jgi:hypothetical protein
MGCCPGSFDHHSTGMSTADLGNATVASRSQPRLTNARVEPEVAHQLLRRWESANITDRCDETDCYGDVDAGNRQQTTYLRIVERCFCQSAVNHRQVFAEPVEFAQSLLDRTTLIAR